MAEQNKLAILLDKLRKKDFTIKRVAAMIGYSYKTVRTQKASENPSPYIIEKIEEVFKKELLDDAEMTPPQNYPADQQTDNPTFQEDEVQYGGKKEVVFKVGLTQNGQIMLTADWGKFLEAIKDTKNGSEPVKTDTTSQSEQTVETSKTTSIQHTSDKNTVYDKGKRKSKKKDTDQPDSPDGPAQ